MTMLDILQMKTENEINAKQALMRIEERKMVLEERKMKLEEEKFELEKKERESVITNLTNC